MTALLDVGCHLPDLAVDVGDVCAAVDADPRLLWTFRRFYGLQSVRRAPDLDLRGMMTAAVASLTALRGNEHRVRYVILARTVTTVAPAGEHPVEDVCVALGLPNAVAFTLTQHACATGLLAVDLAGQLLAGDGDPDALALVLTGEKVFNPVLEIIPESTVMGESSAACLVSAGGDRDRLLGYATRTLGRYAEQFPPHPLDPSFLKEHNDVLADVIRDACAAAGVGVDDLALILPHNVNRLSWQWTCRILDVPIERVYLDNVPVTGHCFTADPFINYVHARDTDRLRPGDLYLMASVGLGATFSAAVLRH
ncbi:3-oxoacyl-[acyl-carrier-protein] synthase III C-terminal domain-containing protein [Micromonospora cathayae]|uniref:3-oxoacyl-[acyl-carrier-protein] synthase III C-terminal domain-containing protein n=1 Tax=Micromonospora cathayae TaxID=3028804 RepID=A0ABY7ZLV7_9ACTN|nr:3-oxoacyl-[acyl-carrier-protein] synthase III C-terminal domain-containing protein [Micromonospora sp. HUAS 3]WDZ83426.1 3-oxoacyl-[acyl-carrier-protein] synthase III C-terminal domain-containing protein [Micromonospora sp. HUAS 3]